MFGHGNWDYMNHMGSFHMGGFFFWFIILIVIFLLYSSFKDNNDCKNKDNPLDILKSKFARGDISEEEYISKKEILNK